MIFYCTTTFAPPPKWPGTTIAANRLPGGKWMKVRVPLSMTPAQTEIIVQPANSIRGLILTEPMMLFVSTLYYLILTILERQLTHIRSLHGLKQQQTIQRPYMSQLTLQY